MSKKLAAGADVIVLDVKYGRGAFMPDADQAKALAQAMVAIGQGAGRKVSAVVSSMQEPLGNAIGNALEVAEAIQLLRGEAGSAPLLEMSILLTGELLRLAEVVADRHQGELRAREALASGRGLAKLGEFIKAQGGDAMVCQDLGRLPQASVLLEVTAPRAGFIQRIDPLGCAAVATELGAGRSRKEDRINPAVGLVLAVRHGTAVQAGDSVATIHAANPAAAALAGERLIEAITIGPDLPVPLGLVEAIIE
jgi:thymidine phosphorylase